MTTQGANRENLKDLFEKFLTSDGAGRAAEDVHEAERILHDYPAPEPSDTLIADIKTKIAQAVPRRKANAFRKTVYKVAVVAAAVILTAAISVRLFQKGNGKAERITYASIIPKAVWESEDIAADDTDLAILNDQTEQIETEILALQLGQTNGNGPVDLTELETELSEINNNFWKG